MPLIVPYGIETTTNCPDRTQLSLFPLIVPYGIETQHLPCSSNKKS